MPIDRRPNLFLVGAQKSGTTTLSVMLASHPNIFMSEPKEPGYLAFGDAGYTALDGYGRIPNARTWVTRSERAYLDLFQGADAQATVLGEASTWYLSEPGCAERLREFSPDARIVLILRHPAERAYSAWCHARRDGEEPCADFDSALEAEASRDAPSHLLRYREMGRYATYLRRYLRVFGEERVLVLFFEDLLEKPESLWTQCQAFLQVPEVAMPAAHRQNRSGVPRSRLLYRLLRSRAFKRRLKALLPLPLLAAMKNRVDTLNLRRFPPMPEDIGQKLREEFRDEIVDLQALTGRDLTHWLSGSRKKK
jgi:hypothetical protein